MGECQRRIACLSVLFWHSECKTPRNDALLEAVLKQARTTRHPWLVTCDANMCPEDFEKSLWFQRETMHVVALKGYPRADRKAQRMSGSKEPMTTPLRVAVSKEKSYKWRWLKILSQDHVGHYPIVVRREKEIKGMERQKLPKVLLGYSGGRLPVRRTKGKCKEEGEVNEDGGERKIRSQIAQVVVAGIKEMVRVHDGEKDDVKRPAEQSFMRSWDCSQIENEEEEESWRGRDQMAAQWKEVWNKEGLDETP